MRNQRVLDRLSLDAKSHMLATMPASLHSDRFRLLLDDPNFHIFYHAPVMILISANAEGPWIVEDCALAAENLMLAAHAIGLGTCWIGFAQGFLNTPDGKSCSAFLRRGCRLLQSSSGTRRPRRRPHRARNRRSVGSTEQFPLSHRALAELSSIASLLWTSLWNEFCPRRQNSELAWPYWVRLDEHWS